MPLRCPSAALQVVLQVVHLAALAASITTPVAMKQHHACQLMRATSCVPPVSPHLPVNICRLWQLLLPGGRLGVGRVLPQKLWQMLVNLGAYGAGPVLPLV
jgi:hypothetical protein